MFGLARVVSHQFEQRRLDAGRAAQPPQHARQAQHQLALDGRFGVVVGCHRGFEGLVIVGILKRGNDGLGGKAMAQRIAA